MRSTYMRSILSIMVDLYVARERVLTRPVFVADQGESNAGAPERYARCFPEMISDWRHRWAGDADIPFIFAQIAPVCTVPHCRLQLVKARIRTSIYRPASDGLRRLAVAGPRHRGDHRHPLRAAVGAQATQGRHGRHCARSSLSLSPTLKSDVSKSKAGVYV